MTPNPIGVRDKHHPGQVGEAGAPSRRPVDHTVHQCGAAMLVLVHPFRLPTVDPPSVTEKGRPAESLWHVCGTEPGLNYR